jgi:hypothetical protein
MAPDRIENEPFPCFPVFPDEWKAEGGGRCPQINQIDADGLWPLTEVICLLWF